MKRRQMLTVLRDHWVVFVGLVAVAALIIAVDPIKLSHALVAANTVALAVMIPVVLLLYAFHGVAWWIALRGLNIPVGLRQALKVTFISQAFDLLPGGDLWKVPIVRSEDGTHLNVGVVAAAVIFDDLVYYFVLTFAMVPAAVALPAVRAPLAIALLPQLAIFVILLTPQFYDPLAGWIAGLRPFRGFATQLESLGPSFRRLVTVRTVIPIVTVDAICSLLAIGLYGLAVTAVHATGVSIDQIAFTYATGQVVSGLTVLPAALGAYEGMMTGLLAVQGVAPAVAAASALLYRVINDVLMALIGLAVAFLVDREFLSSRLETLGWFRSASPIR
jgi:uncharacterized membrane protein YbhN (UPF0104 family)